MALALVGTAYAVDAKATYQGFVYRCRQAHTSLVGWEPPNVPALWLNIGADDGGGNGDDTQAPTGADESPGDPDDIVECFFGVECFDR